jgi:hypothetical protein
MRMNSADKFLKTLGNNKHTFQTFIEDKNSNKKYLNKQFHGSLNEFKEKLVKWNRWGVGVFVTINQTDGKGRKAKNVTKVRALFADLDGSPLQPILDANLEPHMIIESSKGKYHAYWLVNDCPLDKFSMYQKAIARNFNSDPQVHDLSRVMRMPGFDHCKGKHFPTEIIKHITLSPYHIKDIEHDLGLELEQEKIIINSGELNAQQPQHYENVTSDKFINGRRNSDLFIVACGMRGRGETYINIRSELLSLNQQCQPPLKDVEVLTIIDNVWNRYQSV